MHVHILLAIVLAIASPALGRVFTKCELAQELHDIHGFPQDQLPDWVCLVQNESGLNSTAVGGPNSNGSFDWGLFQINDGYWCNVGSVGNDCNMDCNQLIDDDITDDVACVHIVYARHGFSAWNAWKAKCQEELPELDECFLLNVETRN